jgi:hypothetical protein
MSANQTKLEKTNSILIPENWSTETIVKLQVKIEEIKNYHDFNKNYKNKISDTDTSKTLFSMAHRAIYTLYRSIFKDIEDTRLSIDDFYCSESIKNAHSAVINIVDKDICHHDRNSKTFKLMDRDALLNTGQTLVSQSFLSDDQLDMLVDFLDKELLPKIQDVEIK